MSINPEYENGTTLWKPTAETLAKYGLVPTEGETLFTAIHITDAHNSPQGKIPSSRTETYHEDTEREYASLAAAIKELNAECVISSGDLFHLKAQSLYTPESILIITKRIESLDKSFFSIPGNHDLPNSSFEEIEKSAYAVTMRSAKNAVDLSDHQPKPVSSKCPLPVRVWGLPFYPRERLLIEMAKLNDEMDLNHINIVALHGDFFPDGFNNPWIEPIHYSSLCGILTKANVFCLGHIHLSYDVFYQNSVYNRPQMVSKPWSFGRVVRDLHQSAEILEFRHKPSFGYIVIHRTDSGEIKITIQYGVVDHAPFETTFIRNSLTEEIKESKKVSEYVQSLRKGAEEGIAEPEKFMETKAALALPPRVKELIDKHLEAAK